MPKNTPSRHWDDEQLRATAHDLKNELASILALTEMLEVLLPDEAQTVAKPQVQKIRERIVHTSHLVTDVFKSLREEKKHTDSLRE